jgi:hypothetical protein
MESCTCRTIEEQASQGGDNTKSSHEHGTSQKHALIYDNKDKAKFSHLFLKIVQRFHHLCGHNYSGGRYIWNEAPHLV